MNNKHDNYNYHFGIDVAKDRLDIHCLEDKKFWQIDNEPSAIKKFLQENIKILERAFVVIYMLGGYERVACDLFIGSYISVHRANSFRVKSFIRACGQLSKTDRSDAIMLAIYGKDRKENLSYYQPRSKYQPARRCETILALKSLVERRHDLIKMQTAEKNRAQAPVADKLVIKTCRVIIKTLQSQIKILEDRIDELINLDDETLAKTSVLQTMIGIGSQTTRILVAIMPELGTMNSKQVASLAGLAPRANESGSKSGYRFIKGGRPMIKNIMFMVALSASRHDPKHKKHYEKLIKNGKKPIVAITAITRKIIVIANAKIRDNVYLIN